MHVPPGSNSLSAFHCGSKDEWQPGRQLSLIAHLLMTGRDMVMRSGGGLGEFSTGSTQLSVAASWERLGNREATWPSGPKPSSMASKIGSPATHMPSFSI